MQIEDWYEARRSGIIAGAAVQVIYTALMVTRGRFTRILVVGTVLSWLVGGCEKTQSQNRRIIVLAAASLSSVMQDLATAFEQRTHVSIQISAAASGVLRRQIEQGAACDVFVSADEIEMNKLIAARCVEADTVRTVAGNSLVVLGCDQPEEPWSSLGAIADTPGRIAIGDPAYVPAGRYARDALKAADCWTRVSHRLMLADSVRVAAEYVRLKQASVGLVYKSDIPSDEDCIILYECPRDIAEVTYLAAVGAQSGNPSDAAAFHLFLADATQRGIWQAHGFVSDSPN